MSRALHGGRSLGSAEVNSASAAIGQLDPTIEADWRERLLVSLPGAARR
ncbi:hypothetical protein JJB09_02500 [Rhizobium sp. KVB221]|uniref:Uncharacterized protein n=1 Tax=Rhizobium setariae TaxID=2801340 RepID=A0A936YIH6_9HYPH|nr:hypothetical protein [Rhizobium setariae]MBL0370889.1 hypothetical protein [Rhizobium setariae]